jgi:hypothetical protein
LLIACKSVTTIPESTVVPYSGFDQSQVVSYADLFQHRECSLPCWNGIEVDKTNFNNAKEILIKRYGVENIESFDKKNIDWKAHGIDGVNEGYISFSEDVVAEILIIFNIDSGLTIGDLVTVFGKPTWVFISDQPNNPCRGFKVEYPTIRFQGSLDTPENEKVIQPSSRIFMIRFLQKELVENMQVYDGYLVRWDGYKKYCGN